MSKWRPIKTAPKDGTRVIVSDGKYVTEAHWSEEPNLCCGENMDEPCWLVFDCEQDTFYSEDLRDTPPTHWQPLPEAPK